MAELVAAIGVPHSPHYPAQYPKDAADETPRTYRAVKERLDAAKADAIVVIANDHFNTFFMDNFPTFAIGVAEASSGPNDKTRMPHYDFAVDSELASHILTVGMVALHFLTDGVQTPVVPIWVNTFVKPLPTARRCYALGNMLKGAIESLPKDMRVAVLGTGSFSLEVAGPRVTPGGRAGVPDIAWSKHLHHRIKNAEIDDILVEATPERMWQYRRRTAQLDCHAGHREQRQAVLSRRS